MKSQVKEKYEIQYQMDLAYRNLIEKLESGVYQEMNPFATFRERIFVLRDIAELVITDPEYSVRDYMKRILCATKELETEYRMNGRQTKNYSIYGLFC